MPMPSLPSTINASKWKSAAKDADKSGAFEAIGKLARAHLAYDSKALDNKEAKSADEANKRLTLLRGQAGALAEVRAAVKALDKAAGEFRKDKDKSKADLAKQLDRILSDAEGYLKELEGAATQTELSLTLAVRNLAAQEASGDDEGNANLDKLLLKVKGVLTRELLGYEPKKGEPSIYKFFFAWSKADGLLLAGKSKFGSKHAEMVKELWKEKFVPSNITNGDLSFDARNGTWVFSCRGKLPPRNNLIAALKKDQAEGGVGKNLKFKLQKLVKGKDGQETFEDATEQDEAAVDGGGGAATSEATSQQAQATATASAPAQQPQAPAAQGSKAEAANPDQPLPLPGFAPAVEAWKQSRKRYEKEVAALANSLSDIYREELAGEQAAQVRAAINAAKAKLAKTATLVGNTVDTALAKVSSTNKRAAQRLAAQAAKKEMDALAAKLLKDEVFRSLEGPNNELQPNMNVVSELTKNLKKVQETLAEAIKP